MAVLASFSAVVQQVGFGAFGSGIIEQLRDDTDPPPSFNAAVSLGVGEVGLLAAIQSRVRWTGERLRFNNENLAFAETYGAVTYEDSMTPGQQATARFQTIGELWAFPSEQTAVDPPDPSLPPTDPATGASSPRAWGNKSVELFFSFGRTPRNMIEHKMFKGVAFQKSNQGDTAIVGEITCVDESIRYADIALCYELQPHSGRRRGQITLDLAAAVGIDPADVITPVGNPVNKPILLSNGSLLVFLNELWKPENGFAYFNEDGKLVVELIELKTTPDWTIDASLGDYDLDQIEEVLPTRPPSQFYVTASIPVQGTDSSGGPHFEHTITSEEQTAEYNPKCVQDRPSGQTSYLLADGHYHVNAGDTSMVVSRVERESLTQDGLPIVLITRRFGWYNAEAKDPNFNTFPKTNDYTLAYGDGTFHIEEEERFQEIEEIATRYSYNDNATITRIEETTKKFHAPYAAGDYRSDPDRAQPVNGPFNFVFRNGRTRAFDTEIYNTFRVVTRDYTFDEPTGHMLSIVDEVKTYFAPEARCDVVTDGTLTGPAWFGPVVLPPGGNVVAAHDFKYADDRWANNNAETFGVLARVTTTFNWVEGILQSRTEDTYAYGIPFAPAPLASAANATYYSGPPYFYADGTWRIDVEEHFQKVISAVTTYTPRDANSHQETTETTDLMSGAVSSTTQLVNGRVPTPPTIDSPLTRLILQPISGVLEDSCISTGDVSETSEKFVESKIGLDMPWAETIDEIQRQSRRALQRASAIRRTIRLAANPLIKRGHTVRLIDPKRRIDKNHLAVERVFTRDCESGGCDLQLTLEDWVR